MTTELRKPVKRLTVNAVPTVKRKIVVYLLPGDVLGFREEGRRRIWTVPIGRVYTQTVRWTIEAERSAKKKGKQR